MRKHISLVTLEKWVVWEDVPPLPAADMPHALVPSGYFSIS